MSQFKEAREMRQYTLDRKKNMCWDKIEQACNKGEYEVSMCNSYLNEEITAFFRNLGYIIEALEHSPGIPSDRTRISW